MSSSSLNKLDSLEGQVDNTEKGSTASLPVAAAAEVTESDFPDGGLRAWLTVVGGALVGFCTFGMVQSFGVFQDHYTRILLPDRTASEISWIGSFQVFLLFGAALPAGKLFDEGYFHHLLISGTCLHVVSLFMLSLVKPHHYYQYFLSQGLVLGLAMAIMFLPALSIITHYFRKRQVIALGLVYIGSSLGGIIWPIMLNHLLNSSAGFAWGVRIAGFISLVLLSIANSIMRTRLPSRKHRPPSARPNFVVLLTDGPYWMAIIGGFLVLWGLFFPFFYLQLFSVLHGLPPSMAPYVIPILNAGSLIGRVVINYFADKWGRFNFIVLSALMSGALMFAMLGATGTAGMVVFAIFYGLFSGAFLALTAATLSVFARDLEEVGLRLGFGMTMVSAALLIGNPISGNLLNEPLYKWNRPIIFNAVVIFVGSVFLSISRHYVPRLNVKRKWVA